MPDTPAAIARRVRNAIKPVPLHPKSPDAPPATPPAAIVNGVSGKALLAFIERIERVQEEIRSSQADVHEIKKEAKGFGFDVKIVNWLLKLRRQDADDRAEDEALLDIYKRAIGMD